MVNFAGLLKMKHHFFTIQLQHWLIWHLLYSFYKAVAKPLIKYHKRKSQQSALIDTVNTSINYETTKQTLKVTSNEIPDVEHDVSGYREPLIALSNN